MRTAAARVKFRIIEEQKRDLHDAAALKVRAETVRVGLGRLASVRNVCQAIESIRSIHQSRVSVSATPIK
jgi:hypothetical protein